MTTESRPKPESFTQRALKALQPADSGPYEVTDPARRGLLLRVERSGAKAWWFRYRSRVDGKRRRVHLGAFPDVTVEAARDAAEGHSGDISRSDRDPALERRARRQRQREEAEQRKLAEERARILTLRAYVDERYEAYAREHQVEAAANVKRLRTAFADLLDRKIDSLTEFQMTQWRAQRRKAGASRTTIQRDETQLRSLLHHAVRARLITTDDLPPMKKLPRSQQVQRVRFLSSQEEAELRTALNARDAEKRAGRERYNAWRRARDLAELPTVGPAEYPDHLTPLILLALNTGLRQGELFALRWRAIDFGRGVLQVEARAGTKSGRGRVVPLNSEALRVLDTWRRQCASVGELGFVFAGERGRKLDNVQTSWEGVRAAAKLSDFRFHDLRHTFASHLVQQGVGLERVKELLGHASFEMTLRYAHLRDDDLRAAVEKRIAAA